MTVIAPAGLSTLMKEGSQAEHTEAETSTFMSALLEGHINEAGYVAYLSMLRPVYAALEGVGRDLADQPVAGAIVDPRLERLATIDEDLAFWAPEGYAEPDSPAVASYVARIEASRAAPHLFVSHHYTRYLGDLSGGQAIGRLLSRHFGLTSDRGVAFYDFTAVGKPKPYKDAYRVALDELDLTDSQRSEVVDEVRAAFALNGAIFAELTGRMAQFARP